MSDDRFGVLGERLGRFLDEHEKDRSDGITLRSVHNRLVGHVNRYESDQKETRDRLKGLETRNEMEDKFDAVQTGRHQAIKTPQAFTPAFGIAVPIEARPAHEPKKSSGFWKSAKASAFRHGGTALGTAAITLLVSWLAGHGCQAAQAVDSKPAAAASHQ